MQQFYHQYYLATCRVVRLSSLKVIAFLLVRNKVHHLGGMLGPKLTFFLFSIYYLVTSVLILFGPQLIFIGSLSLANLLDIRRLRLPSNKSHLLWVPSCIRRAQIPFIMGPVLSKAGIFLLKIISLTKKNPERLF